MSGSGIMERRALNDPDGLSIIGPREPVVRRARSRVVYATLAAGTQGRSAPKSHARMVGHAPHTNENGGRTLMANAKPIPEGHHTITPGLVVKGGRKAIDFYKAAFGAKERG